MSDETSNENKPEGEVKDEDILGDIDAFLSDEDPDFVKGLSDVKIDNASIRFSVLDQAMDMDEADIPAPHIPFFSVENFIQMIDVRANARKVMLFWFSIFVIICAVYFSFQTNMWDRKSSLFLTSFSQWQASVRSYNPLSDTQFFFDNPRLSKNIVELKKMYVNLKPSENSSDNPMLAFSITVEGLSKEVVVELKDRESEFVDRASRLTEEFTYDELSTTEGKQKLSEKIIDIFNANLTSGQVRKVMYATFILKN